MSDVQQKSNGDSVGTPTAKRAGTHAKQEQLFAPQFDIWEGSDAWLLYGDLPGVAPENVEIHYEDHRLTIHGKVDRANPEQKVWYAEYGVGDFHRSFSVGDQVDAANISAELKDGVLTVRLPKQEAAKPRRIEIKAV